MAQGRVCLAADVSAVAMTPDLAAEVRGVDLSAPISDACFRRILEIYQRYCVIFLRNQRLDPQLLVRFATRFGELDVHPGAEQLLPGLPQVRVLSTRDKSERAVGIVRGGVHWHSDLSYMPAPTSATLLYAIQCPPEGMSTEFINMYSAYDALPREKRLFLDKLRAVHDRGFRYAELYPNRPPLSAEEIAKLPPAEHPLVRVHPQTRRKALFVAKDVVSHVLGLGPKESRKLIDELEAFASQPRFTYAHRWQPGDLLVWDNRCTLHRAMPYDGKHERTLHCVQVKGEVPVAG
jgi:taurine dioxygenase